MKFIRITYKDGIYQEKINTHYFALSELKSFSYDVYRLEWKFEFPGKSMHGHSEIDLQEFEFFFFSDAPFIYFEDEPFLMRNGNHFDENGCHLREVKRANQED